jgi:hypothetical protein
VQKDFLKWSKIWMHLHSLSTLKRSDWQIGKDIYLSYTHVYTLTLLKVRTASFTTTFDTRQIMSRMSLIIWFEQMAIP